MTKTYTGGSAVSIPKGVSLGTVWSLLVTMLMCAATAMMVDRGLLKEKNVGYVVMVLATVASYIGACVSKKKIKRQKLKVCLLSGAVYMVTLLAITALFFGGQYSSVPETALLILCGSILAVMTEKGEGRRGRIRKFKNRSR